jgi:adenylate cyclase
MAVEIERKFLVSGHWPRERSCAAVRIDQGYLPLDDAGVEIRVRAREGERFMTVKGGTGLARTEWEQPVPAAVFDLLWPLTAGRRITKLRHAVPVGRLTAEVDVFLGELSGLTIVEVEFADTADADAFTAPDWFGTEVTARKEYRNRALAR